MIDEICFEYRGRLSITEAMHLPLGDLLLLRKFIIDKRMAAKEREDKEKQKTKQNDKVQQQKIMNARFSGLPTPGINDPGALTREESEMIMDELEESL